MDSFEVIFEFFLGFFSVFAGGKLETGAVLAILGFGLVMSAVAIFAAVFAAKATKKGMKLAVVASVFCALAILTAPLYNNVFKNLVGEYVGFLRLALSGGFSSSEAATSYASSLISTCLTTLPIISILGVIMTVAMILTLVFMGKNFKAKYKIFPIFGFILVFVRYMIFSPIAISLTPFLTAETAYIDNILAVIQLMLYCFTFALPYVLLIPFAALNFVKNKKAA